MIARLRATPVRVRNGIRIVCFLVPFWIWAISFLSGFSHWPLAPIREEGGRFLDKRGVEHTEEDYAAFRHWEESPLVRFGGFAAFASYAIASVIVGLPLFERSSAKPPLETSEDFRRFFPLLIGGVALALVLLFLVYRMI